MAERNVVRLLAVNDRLLAPLLLAAGDTERRDALEQLIVQEIQPLVRRILSRQRAADNVPPAEELEDVESTVSLRLVQRLAEVPYEEGAAIERLADYTATLTFNVLYDRLRRRFPEWTRLKNRARYAATHDARFVAHTTAAGLICALRAWPASNRVAQPVIPARPPRRMLDRERVGDAIEALLLSTGAAVTLDDLARALAELWNVADVTPRASVSPAADSAVAHDIRLEGRQYLEVLWREISELPPAQRAALLLNLRDTDGGNVIALFILLGITTLETIAAALEVPVDELASLWNRLPLDDQTIASMLGLERQRVINLRKSARERLARRMRKK